MATHRAELIVFLLGLMVFSVGLSLAWPPLGLIGGGIVLMLITIINPGRK